MLLSEIFESISYGELANLYAGTAADGEIAEKHYPKILANINLGLVELHKRFPILLKQVNIQLYEHISTYVLDKKYAQSNTSSTVTYKYIMDSSYFPFNNDVIRITRVANEDCCYYPLNTESDPLSLFTPAYNTVQIPYPIKENAIAVEYQAYPARIPLNTTDIENYEVEFPEFLLEPLLTFINYKMFTNVGMDKPEAPNYMQKFELECRRISDLGVFNLDHDLNLKLECRGWV